jgi:acyl carrier protein
MREGEQMSGRKMREELRQRLPEYMVPVVYVEMERMPVNANGKLDRKGLPEVEEVGVVVEEEYEEARTETEAKLVKIWSEVMGVERVGVKDNFFELGGHSLLATRMISIIRDVFQVELPIAALFTGTPTIAEMAKVIEKCYIDQSTGDEVFEALRELNELSDSEVRELLKMESELMIDPEP